MDEPFAAMSPAARHNVMCVIQEFKKRNISIILVSHVLEDVFAISDRIAILRFGRLVGARQRDETTPKEIVSMMHELAWIGDSSQLLKILQTRKKI